MIQSGRVMLPILAGLVLPAVVVWLVWSVSHLIASATAYHVRVVAPPAGAVPASAAEVARLLAEQNHWGILAMSAVAGVAAAVVLTMLTWLTGGPRRPDRR